MNARREDKRKQKAGGGKQKAEGSKSLHYVAAI
jgi:hypothetical protein